MTSAAAIAERLHTVPSLGWIVRPSPVTAMSRLASALGCGWLGVKRDDQLEALRGGSKARKLDILLAREPWASAPAWHALGAIGSGHVVAMTEAARRRGRSLHAHLFWEPTSPRVLDNLAFIASGPTTLTFAASSARLALRRPGLLLRTSAGGLPVVPPGGSLPFALVGVVRGALELAAQIESGLLPVPDRLYVALGSGGTAVGLAVGLALAGLSTEVRAIATASRALTGDHRLGRLEAGLRRELEAAGVAAAPPVRLVIDRRFLGPGYGRESDAGRAAMERATAHGFAGLEGIYTAKAFAALIADTPECRGKSLLFWHTAHPGPLPHDDHWRERLPAGLRRRLEAPAPAPGPTRRRLLIAGGITGLVLTMVRFGGYRALPGFSGAVLSGTEAEIVRAAAAAFLPEAGPAALDAVPVHVDRFLVGMPADMLREVHGMLALLEHGTVIDGRLHRMSSLTPGDAARFFENLGQRGGLWAQAARALRDLCFLGYYQQPATWTALGYEGPRVGPETHPKGPGRMVWPAYEDLKAKAGTLPRLVRGATDAPRARGAGPEPGP